jgi:hypothetical protein
MPEIRFVVETQVDEDLVAVLIRRSEIVVERATVTQNFYNLYELMNGKHIDRINDFERTVLSGETFTPILSKNDYDNMTCYKMQVVSPDVAHNLVPSGV